jgi:hypothetical protein
LDLVELEDKLRAQSTGREGLRLNIELPVGAPPMEKISVAVRVRPFNAAEKVRALYRGKGAS